jgi:hypothetical protein
VRTGVGLLVADGGLKVGDFLGSLGKRSLECSDQLCTLLLVKIKFNRRDEIWIRIRQNLMTS